MRTVKKSLKWQTADIFIVFIIKIHQKVEFYFTTQNISCSSRRLLCRIPRDWHFRDALKEVHDDVEDTLFSRPVLSPCS
jgi:hypothetical protein